MKKKLLNQKNLKPFFYSLSVILLFSTGAVAQKTIINETFGTTVIANPYVGGTSTVPASPNQITYTKTSTATTSGTDAIAVSSSNGYLALAGAAVTGRTYITAPMPSTNFVSVLKNNPYPITWTFNMRLNRSTNIDGLTSTATTNYVPAVVLVSNSSDLLSSTTKGYAVSISLGSVALQQKVELSYFTDGLGLASSVAPTSVISSPDFLNGDYVSVKVTYIPSTNTWSLAVKDNGVTAFSDPAADTYTNTAQVYSDVNTSDTMSNFGYLYYHNTGSAIFRVDNYKMVLESPYIALPTVEKRLTFNSSTNPKVANLVAVGTGGTLNWYSVVGGSALAPIVPLTSGTYYVSQTVNGVESDVVSTSVYVGDTTLKTLPFYESFANYTIGDKLILMNNAASANAAGGTAGGIGLGSWTLTPSTNITDDVTIAAGLTTTVIPAATGNAITFSGSGIDPELKFTNTTSGSLFSSFVFIAADVSTITSAQTVATAASAILATGVDPAKSTPTGFFSFSSEPYTDPVTSLPITDYTSDVMFRKVIGTPNKFNLGLSKSNNIGECVWSPIDYDFGTQHLIVISYEKIGDANALNQVANLWIDPTSTTQSAVTLTQNSPTTSVSRDHIDRIKILQAASTSTPTMIIDEIRVANNWGQALGVASTLDVAKVDVSQLKVYPNPVTNGKLFISSNNSNEKQVAIYSILGQKVLEAKTNNNEEINVSPLAKGAYILNIMEEGVSETKKLLIQ